MDSVTTDIVADLPLLLIIIPQSRVHMFFCHCNDYITLPYGLINVLICHFFHDIRQLYYLFGILFNIVKQIVSIRTI